MQRQADPVAHPPIAAAAGNLAFESIPALQKAGVRADQWSAAQQLAQRRVLSRLLQALFREALLNPGQLIADTRADVTLLPIWQQRVVLRFTGLRAGALGSWTLTGDVAVLAHDQPPVSIDRPSTLLHWLSPMLDTGDATDVSRLTAIARLSAELDNSQDNDTLCQAYRLAWGERLAAEHGTSAAQDALASLTDDGTPHALARTEQWGTGGHPGTRPTRREWGCRPIR